MLSLITQIPVISCTLNNDATAITKNTSPKKDGRQPETGMRSINRPEPNAIKLHALAIAIYGANFSFSVILFLSLTRKLIIKYHKNKWKTIIQTSSVNLYVYKSKSVIPVLYCCCVTNRAKFPGAKISKAYPIHNPKKPDIFQFCKTLRFLHR